MKVLSLSATTDAVIFGIRGKEEKVVASLHVFGGRLRIHCEFPSVSSDLFDRLKDWFVAPFDTNEEAFLNRVLAESKILDLLRERFPDHEISFSITDRPR